MKHNITKLLYLILIVSAFIPYLLFLANIDAQRLLCDDYSMFFPIYRDQNLLDTIETIITGINSAQIRITFIPHIFFIGFYRYTNGGPFATNLFFLVLLGLVVSTIVVTVLIINYKKTKKGYVFDLKNLVTKQNIFLFVVASYLLISQYVWSLMDFKLANYLTFGLFILVIFLFTTYTNGLKTKISLITYLLLYIITVHSTDVNVLALAIVIPVIFLKKITLKTKYILSALMILYPPGYYFGLKTALNRDSVLFNEVPMKTLFMQFKFWVKPFIEFNQLFFLTLGIVLIITTALVMRKFFKSLNKKNRTPLVLIKELHIYLFDREKIYAIGVFFSVFPVLILIITNLAYGGWINPHQFGFAYLLFILSLMILIKSLFDNLPKYKILSATLICLSLVFIVFHNTEHLVNYWKIRRAEMSLITSLENHIGANRETYGDKNYIVIDSWPSHTFSTYTAFYNVSWASKSYAQFYLDSDSQKFEILSTNSILYWGLDADDIKSSDTETSSLIYVSYDIESKTAQISDYHCKLMCGEQAIEILDATD